MAWKWTFCQEWLRLGGAAKDHAQLAQWASLSKKLADEIVSRSQAVVKQWPKIADSLKVRGREQERMAAAFRRAG